MSLDLSRRTFLTGTAAVAVVAALPMPALAAVESPGAVAAPAVGVVGTWGYSFDDETYCTGYASEAEALAEAEGYADAEEARATVAFCVREELRPIDGADVAADWLSGCVGGGSYGETVVSKFIDAQEDVDFEGELMDALGGIPDGELIARANDMLLASLIRIGSPTIASRVASGERPTRDKPLCDDDAIFKRLCADKVLTATLNEALFAWSDVPSVDRTGRMLQLSDSREVIIPAATDASAVSL